MDTQAELLQQIEAFLATCRMAETTFGRLAVNDGKFVRRLRSNGNMTLSTVEKVRAFLRARSDSNRPPAEQAACPHEAA